MTVRRWPGGEGFTPKIEGDKRNEPLFVKHIVQKIADLRGISFDEVADVTTGNARKLFRI